MPASPRPPARFAPSSLSRTTQGRLLVLIAFVAFSFAGVMAKAVYTTGAEPLSLLVIRFSAAAVLLSLLARRQLWAIPRRRRVQLLAMGAGFALQALTFYSAIAISPVGLVVVVVAVYPVLVVLLDAAIGRKLPGLGRTVLLLVSLGGLWLAAGSPTGRPEPGLLLAVGCAVIYAIYLKASEGVLGSVSPVVATTWVASGALLLSSAVAVAMLLLPGVTAVSWPSAAGFGLAALHGVLTNALPVVALYAAIRRLGAMGVAGMGPLEPVMSTGLAAMLLGERLGVVQLVGGAIVLLVVSQLAGMRPRALMPRIPVAVPMRATAWWRTSRAEDLAHEDVEVRRALPVLAQRLGHTGR